MARAEREAPATTIPPPPFLSDPALRRVLAALPDARLVGGCVRDALAGRAVADVDLATRMQPDDVVRALAAAGLTSAPTGIDHGTVTAIADHRGFEVTTLRRDVETDGRHAVVVYTEDWREDASRRDFSINAMSMTSEGAVFDYFGGIADLAAGRVRFVGDPATRIAEDCLRVLRFFRFFARYGAGEPDPAAMAAIRDGVGGLARLSPERVWAELKRILVTEAVDIVIGLMRETGVWEALLSAPPPPERGGRGEGRLPRDLVNPTPPPDPLPQGEGETQLSKLPADPILRLAALHPGDVAERLRMSTAERERLLALASPPPPTDADDALLRRLLADTPPYILIGRAWLAASPSELRDRIAAIEPPIFPLQGRDLLAAGVAPGPAMGLLLRDLRAWWIKGGCVATAEELAAELARRRGG